MRVSTRSVWWVCAAVVAAGIGFAAYWFLAGRVTDSYSNDVGAVLVSADGRTISASAPGQVMGECTDNTSSNLVVTETAHTVEVRVHSRVEHGFGMCAPGAAALPPTLSVRLSSPLWGRTLIGGDGKALAYFDGRTLLTPHPVPAGFRLYTVSPGPGFGRDARGSGPGVVQDYNAGPAILWISQQVGTTWQAPDGAQESDTVVRGHAAHQYTDRGSTSVEWAQNGQIVQVTYSDSQAPDASARAFVLAIARSLR